MDVKVNALSKSFRTRDGSRIDALDDVSLSIPQGEFLAVVGPSGCGKSTLLRCIGGLETPTGGEVTVGGQQVREPLLGTGFAFQQAALLPWKTVTSNVIFPARIQGRSDKEARQRAVQLLEQVDLADFADKYPTELSGGMQQRVALIRALINGPSLLLLDEPFGALDALTREKLNFLLQDLWLKNATTVVLVTHSISEAVFLADRVVVMSSRPGQVLKIVESTWPRPRSPDLMETAEFNSMAGSVRRALG